MESAKTIGEREYLKKPSAGAFFRAKLNNTTLTGR
jgi:hypothetical protein